MNTQMIEVPPDDGVTTVIPTQGVRMLRIVARTADDVDSVHTFLAEEQALSHVIFFKGVKVVGITVQPEVELLSDCVIGHAPSAAPTVFVWCNGKLIRWTGWGVLF